MNEQTKLQQLRIQKGFSQSELSRLSGVNFRTLQDFDQGRKNLRNAKGEMIYKLSRALGCSADFLIDDSQPIILETATNLSPYSHIKEYANLLCSKELYGKYYRFPVVVNHDSIDMSRIYPTKQQLISDIHYALVSKDCILSVMLFGSSTTMKCTEDSDTDLAIRLYDDMYSHDTRNDILETVQDICNWKADILWFDSLSTSDRVYHDICKGVQIV